MAKACLSLVLADFATLFANDINRAFWPDTLHKILKKARFEADRQGYYQHLLALFSAHSLKPGDLPIALLRGGSAQSLCADPCYLHPDRDQLRLFYRDLDLSLEEAKAIARRVQPLLEDFHARLEVVSPQEWLMELDKSPEVTFSPLEGLEGLPVTEHLPRGTEAQRWIRLWNEMQMLLFECPENQVREKAHKAPINSLWFWGKGRLPELRQWPHVSGDEPVLARLASESDSGFYPAVSGYKQLNARQALHVLTFDIEQDWQTQMNTLTQDWLIPAFQALKRWRLADLEVIVPEWGIYRFRPLSSWRFR